MIVGCILLVFMFYCIVLYFVPLYFILQCILIQHLAVRKSVNKLVAVLMKGTKMTRNTG